jgi:SAM-dependent methyltransferase
VLDLSAGALALARSRLGGRAPQVRWIEGDITTVELPAAAYDLWHERAVFHFLTDPEARRRHRAAAERAVRPGGHVIIATFGPRGPERCSGLPVVRYDPAALQEQLGPGFAPVRHAQELHRTPAGGIQGFVYCLLRRAA